MLVLEARRYNILRNPTSEGGEGRRCRGWDCTHPNLATKLSSSCLRVDVSYFLCCTRKKERLRNAVASRVPASRCVPEDLRNMLR